MAKGEPEVIHIVRSTPPSGYLARMLLVVGFTFFLLGCASAYKYSYPGHKTFTDSNIDKLYVGMTPTEVRAMFGSPDKTYDASFGENVGESWTGRAWLYFTEKDPSFKHSKRYKKSLLVFYPPGDQMKLNHWHIE